MTTKGIFFSMPKMMGISLAAPLMIHADAQSCIQNRLDVKPDEMAAESMTVEHWVMAVPEEAPEKNTITINLAEPDKEWKGKNERQFLVLARKEALGAITSEELQKLNELSHERDLLKGRLTIKELMFRRRQMETELRLLEAAKEYFRVRNPYGR